MLDNLNVNEPDQLVQVARALSTRARVDMLKMLYTRSMNIIEISEALKLPVSTVANNVKILEAAKLLTTELLPAARGTMKVCTRIYDDIHMSLIPAVQSSIENYIVYEVEIPIGLYSDCEIYPTCGMASGTELIIREAEPAIFYHPKHINAQIIWFSKGYLEYILPLELPLNVTIKSLELSMELCSEAPNFDNDWLSDISVWVNGIEIGMWTSPGVFGDRRGSLNPSWWLDWMTQYGHLKTWRVEEDRTTMDMKKVSDIGIGDLQLEGRPNLRLRIGVDSNADHKGGVNIFGRQFGDYNQDIKMRIQYVPHNR